MPREVKYPSQGHTAKVRFEPLRIIMSSGHMLSRYAVPPGFVQGIDWNLGLLARELLQPSRWGELVLGFYLERLVRS